MIVVTGGLGFIGAHTLRALASLGQRCLAVTRSPVPDPARFAGLGDMMTVVQADAADPSSLRRAGDGSRVSGIVHLAAPAPGPPGERAAFARASADAMLNLLDGAAAWGVPRVSPASSLGVYQGVPDTPYREDARLRQVPADPVPAAKNAIELLAAVVTQSAGPQVVNLRIATIRGPGEYLTGAGGAESGPRRCPRRAGAAPGLRRRWV
jgi:UDP-glucose 4-epimerase